MNAGAKIGSAQLAGVMHQHGHFHRERADGNAGGDRQLLVDADQSGGAAHLRRLDFGIGERVDGGELQRTEEAATTSRIMISSSGVAAVNSAQAARKIELTAALITMILRNRTF